VALVPLFSIVSERDVAALVVVYPSEALGIIAGGGT
jgi:hypothetical protein